MPTTANHRTFVRRIVIILSVAALLSMSPSRSLTTSTQEKTAAKLLYIIDGDTLKVIFQGRQESVRLIGIDTPESRNNRRAAIQSKEMNVSTYSIIRMGRTAKRYVRSLAKKGDILLLEFDIQRRDKYGRLLAYVHLPDGRNLNAEIIGNGFATPLTIPPNVKYANQFGKLYQQARKEGKGLWKGLK